MQPMASLIVATMTFAVAFASEVIIMRDGDASEGSIVHKVVVMLEDMVTTAQAEKRAEEVAFGNFSQWCSNEKASLSNEITFQSQDIDKYSAEASNLDQQATDLGMAIASMQAEVDKASRDLSNATDQRKTDHSNFLAEEQDYSESVSALERAITVLERQSYDRPALMQIADGQLLPSKAQDLIAAFAEMMDASDAASGSSEYGAPEADAYEFQSHSIIDLLKKLLDDFQDELAKCQKEEVNAKHNHDLVAQDLQYFIEQTNQDISEHTAAKQITHEKAAVAKKNLARAQELKAQGEKTLASVNTECFQQTESYNEKQNLRSEELEALGKAIEILSQEEVQGLADKTFLQTPAATALAQLGEARFRGAQSDRATGIRRKLSVFLTSEAQRLHSSRIESLAQQAASDPFEKVKVMIRDLMEKLLEEAHQDATHNGFCNKEMGVNKHTRDALSAEIDGLTADIESGDASITAMTQEIAMLTKEVADHKAAMLEATDVRYEDKTTNTATAKECKEGEDAVKQAIVLLKKFYAKALHATALVQDEQQYPHMGSEEWYSLANTSYDGKADTGHKSGMQTFGDVYQGQQDEAGGVLAMLDVILSDFVSLRTETEASEKLSQKQFETFLHESKTDVAAKSKKIGLLENDKVRAIDKMHADTKDRQYAQDKLESANRYYADLQNQCVYKGVTFEERTAAREAEIQSLKEALEMLKSVSLGEGAAAASM